MRIGIPWKKKDLYEHIKKEQKFPDDFILFSTFERRLRQPEFDYIECRFNKANKDYRYVMAESIADTEPCVWSKLHDKAMILIAMYKERKGV
jgi:hypothetical protein